MTDKKRLIINVIVSSLAVVSMVLIILTTGIMRNGLQGDIKQLKSLQTGNQNEIVQLESESKSRVMKVETDIKGVSNKQLVADTKAADVFFADAFDWSSGKQYDKVRASYIEKLGKDNVFVTDFLRENMKVEVTDKSVPNNDIDINDLKSEFDNIKLYPVNWKADGTIDYIAVVEYYAHTNKADLADKSALQKTKALIGFTMDGDIGSRQVKQVTSTTAAF